MSFRFVHTADLHLDSPLVSLALRDPALAAEVGTATRAALARTVDLCLAEGAQALLIAGDLWDGSQTSARTARFLKAELARLGEGGVRGFVIRGNHDAMSRLGSELAPPPGTVIFGPRAGTETFEAGGRRIAVHGLSFRDPTAPDSLLPQYPPPVQGAFNIGLMHTSLGGSAGHDTYAPCRLADLEAHGYDYWALGHIHRRSEHRGRAAVVMPGIPQGRDIGEAGDCSVTLGTLADDGTLTLETRSVARLRFDRLEVDLAGVAEWDGAVSALARAVRAAGHAAGRAARAVPHLVLRPRLTGATPLAFRILRDLDRLTEEARAAAEAAEGVWIDRLENATTGETGAAGRLPDDLVRIVTQDLPRDPALARAMAEAADLLARDLPPDLRDLFGQDATAQAALCAGLLAEGVPALLSRLSRPREG